MDIDTEIKNAIRVADKEAQYDEQAKHLPGTWFSKELSAAEMLDIIANEYQRI